MIPGFQQPPLAPRCHSLFGFFGSGRAGEGRALPGMPGNSGFFDSLLLKCGPLRCLFADVGEQKMGLTAQAGEFYWNDHLPGVSPGFQTAAKAAAAGSRGRKPMEKGCPRVEPRRRRQHLPSGASPKAVAEAWEGRACGRDARAPGGHDPSRQQFPHPPEFCKRLY